MPIAEAFLPKGDYLCACVCVCGRVCGLLCASKNEGNGQRELREVRTKMESQKKKKKLKDMAKLGSTKKKKAVLSSVFFLSFLPPMASGRKPDEENQLLTSSAASKKSTDAVKSRKSYQDRESTSSGPPSIDTSRHAFSRLIRNHSNDGCSSRGSSDCDENVKRSKTIAERKRRRIHQHHHASSSPRLLFPRLMRKHKSYGSTNSSLSGHTSSNDDNMSSDDEVASSDDHVTENNADLVLPALDPKYAISCKIMCMTETRLHLSQCSGGHCLGRLTRRPLVCQERPCEL